MAVDVPCVVELGGGGGLDLVDFTEGQGAQSGKVEGPGQDVDAAVVEEDAAVLVHRSRA